MWLLNLFILALICSAPVTSNLFIGILVTYCGLTLLNLFPFHTKLHFPELAKTGIMYTALWCIGYGWRAIISNSFYTPPGIASFIGSAILIAAMAGWFLSLIELSIARSSLSNTEGPVRIQGLQKLVRHPQILFSISFLLGLTLYHWSLSLALTAPLWTIGFISYAALEEKYDLVPRYNKEYLDYCESTPGIIPNATSFRGFLDQYNLD